MAIRFDTGTLKQPTKTPEGYFMCEGTFAREGILEYRTPDGGIRREFRPREENQKALLLWGLKPVTLEHPPILLDSENAKQYQVGMTDSTVFLDGGFVRGVIVATDSKAVESIERGDTVEVSTGYKCDVDHKPGVWNGQHYDAIQRNIIPNHVALTKKGRAGSDVALHLDSDDTDIAYQSNTVTKKTMASLTIKGVTYDSVDPVVASAVGQYISELEKQSTRVDSLADKESTLLSENEQLKRQLEELTEERDRYQGHADAYEIITNKAIPVLEEAGYSWNADSEEFVFDETKSDANAIHAIRSDLTRNVKKDMKKSMKEEDMEDEDEYEDEDEEEEYTSKSKKKDGGYYKKMDSISTRLDAWRKAELLGVTARFDSDLETGEIHRLIASELMPDVDLSNSSDAYVEGVVDRLLIEAESEAEAAENLDSRYDSADIYSTNLQQAVSLARSSANPQAEQQQRSQVLANNYQEPLALSKKSQ